MFSNKVLRRYLFNFTAGLRTYLPYLFRLVQVKFLLGTDFDQIVH